MGFAEWATVEPREWSLWNLRKVKIGKQKFPIKRELNAIPANLLGFLLWTRFRKYFPTENLLFPDINITWDRKIHSWCDKSVQNWPTVRENVGGIFIKKNKTWKSRERRYSSYPRAHYRTLFRDAFLINEKVNVPVNYHPVFSWKISKKKPGSTRQFPWRQLIQRVTERRRCFTTITIFFL